VQTPAKVSFSTAGRTAFYDTLAPTSIDPRVLDICQSVMRISVAVYLTINHGISDNQSRHI